MTSINCNNISINPSIANLCLAYCNYYGQLLVLWLCLSYMTTKIGLSLNITIYGYARHTHTRMIGDEYNYVVSGIIITDGKGFAATT